MQFDNRNFDYVVTTQLAVMDSPAIAEQVIRELRLDRNPSFNTALKKKGPRAAGLASQFEVGRTDLAPELPGLTVRRRPDTYLLEVIYRSTDPLLATAIANSASQAFVQQGFMTRYQNAAELSKWLNKQLEELKAKLERSQKAMRDYEKENNVINPEDR
ncbi:MAG: hypothetical protein HY236_05340, partial [Acidobacteria bacterium]|nr:hypothetical protein [Acidobacteriota bacterium]